MSGIFLRFKRRLNAIRVARSALVGSSVGLILSGVWLVLWKLAVIDLAPISSLYIGLGSALAVAGLTFLFGGKKDKRLAEELDSSFGLKARVQTMIEYMGEDGELVSLQRQDAEATLSKIPLSKYKFKGFWIYILILILSATILAAGFVIKDARDYVPPEEIIPFQLSPLQETGLNNLIKYVEGSQMEEKFSTPIADELKSLLERLREIDTQSEMLSTLASSMEVIRGITYESSTATEIIEALWNSDDLYFKHLAKILDSSEWSDPDWGDFAEKLTEYEGVLMGDDENEREDSDGITDVKDNLKFAVDTMSRKLKTTLEASGIPEDDEMYAAVNGLFNQNPGGLVAMLSLLDYTDEAGARKLLNNCINANSIPIFEAISLNKINANVGEYTMMRLASLFIVSIPEFERPGEMIIQKSGDDNDDNNNSSGDGGVGDGEVYGSKDLVIDPITGESIEYGKLLHKYNAIMDQKLNDGSYTEEQKEAIRKYFALLYSGIKK